MIDLKKIPEKAGVYIYRDKTGKILYVGKAINLKKRVKQYFEGKDTREKVVGLVKQIDSIECQTVRSEIEALVLEANLIKKYKPKYNSQLADDTNYVYICISKEKIPRVFAGHRRKINLEKNEVFGPFPDSRSVNYLLKSLRRIFAFRSFENKHPKNCLYCQIGQCPGEKPTGEYKKNINRIKKILNGGIRNLLSKLKKEMKEMARVENFENAIRIRNRLSALEYVTNGWSSVHQLTETRDLADDMELSAIEELEIVFGKEIGTEKIKKIEAYDISNMGNSYFVGSMVVYDNYKIDKDQYRQFKIRSKNTADDQEMIGEVIERRVRHTEWEYPSFILVDGGKPQTASAWKKLKNKIPVVGLAKKEETIILFNGQKFWEIRLPRYSLGLRLLQRLRDEAHRFANRYRKILQRKEFLKPYPNPPLFRQRRTEYRTGEGDNFFKKYL